MAASSTPIGNDGLADQLAVLQVDVLAEVVREGEQMVESQFVAAQAADQRALALAGVAVTLSSAGVGLLLSGMPAAEPIPNFVLAAIVGTSAATLMIAATMAIIAAMPAQFQFPGNEPENWKPKHWSVPARSKYTLREARVEQALVLQAKIESNRSAAAKRAVLVRRAVWLSFMSVGMALFALMLTYMIATLRTQA